MELQEIADFFHRKACDALKCTLIYEGNIGSSLNVKACKDILDLQRSSVYVDSLELTWEYANGWAVHMRCDLRHTELFDTQICVGDPHIWTVGSKNIQLPGRINHSTLKILNQDLRYVDKVIAAYRTSV